MINSGNGIGTDYSFSVLLEHAADNDVEGFKRSVCDESEIGMVGLWFGHQKFSKKRALELRTPLMVAAKYGSVDVVKLIIALPEVDVNFSCGPDKCTALHCAASGGSVNAVDVVRLLLLAGADPKSSDANGHRPVDVVAASPIYPHLKIVLEDILKNSGFVCQWDLQISTNSLRSSPPPISWSSEEGSLSSISGMMLSSLNCKPMDAQVSSVKKGYPVDPSLPDIKNSIFTTDEFRMFCFKIQPCSRAYSHDWTECPFVHPGENARRRDPRRFNYSCVPCPDHRRGACRRGDMCEYSHGIFECWLHPAQYRTRLCKDGTSCTRRVCFFAHTSHEVRPLYASVDAATQLPQAAAMDFTAALNLLSGSPSSASPMSHFPFTPPLSPRNDFHLPMAWPQQNTSNLQSFGSNLQASRLRTPFSGRYIPSEELNRLQDFELQQLNLQNEVSSMSLPLPNCFSTDISTRLRQLNTLNLDRQLTMEVSSAQNTNQLDAASKFPPSYKSAVLNKQSMLSPIRTSVFSAKNVDYPLQASFDSSSPRRMSPRISEPMSLVGSQLASEKQQLQPGSLFSRELGSDHTYDLGLNSGNSWPDQKSVTKKVDWSIEEYEESRLQKLRSGAHSGHDPDLSWVQSVLKEPSLETEETSVGLVSGSVPDSLNDSNDHVGLPAWLEGMQFDQIVS
ncbi:zinc finger CCCH domain-containing protein 56-like [Mercurialis annua]|uniref:zinc finger CCCH domain-containing protein 56-like n=1 Tax=Mercurialis annua TaxID=3986 RepID=UPI00215F1960|nr:zinc finger CCCH domain-containing protein 56-like [Mercurialis annua]XP_050223327.1 zinc finger CCCH domain-containing protein 56-like [Mercurialis annua]XP_050223328.1 zinc finger CCCH domain-containing protein 56-like [Mercurialis annua]